MQIISDLDAFAQCHHLIKGSLAGNSQNIIILYANADATLLYSTDFVDVVSLSNKKTKINCEKYSKNSF